MSSIPNCIYALCISLIYSWILNLIWISNLVPKQDETKSFFIVYDWSWVPLRSSSCWKASGKFAPLRTFTSDEHASGTWMSIKCRNSSYISFCARGFCDGMLNIFLGMVRAFAIYSSLLPFVWKIFRVTSFVFMESQLTVLILNFFLPVFSFKWFVKASLISML